MWVRILFAEFLFLSLVVPGCVSFPQPSPHKSRHGILIRGSVTEEQVREIDGILEVLPPAMIGAVSSISSREGLGHIGKDNAAHCHFTGDICVQSYNITDPYILFHEVAHAYSYSLVFKSAFHRKWKELAGDVYGKDKEREWGYPKNGIIRSYGATNSDEDIAVWVEHVYLFVTLWQWRMDQLRNAGEFRNHESIYFKKLTLLRDYGFLNEENYQIIIR